MNKNEENVVLKTTCPFCGKVRDITITQDQYNKLKSGNYNIQDVCTNLSADDREALISGICPTCWNKTFGGN